MMKKLLSLLIAILHICAIFPVNAQSMERYTVVSGDSMWKIAVRYEVGLGEIKSANHHIANPNLIYPGQILNIPKTDATVTSYENEVIRLVNDIRVKNGLNTLAADWHLNHSALPQKRF